MAEAIVRDRPATRQIYTVADFEWLARLPRRFDTQTADALNGLHEGELIEMPPVCMNGTARTCSTR